MEIVAEEQAAAQGLGDTVFPSMVKLIEIIDPATTEMTFGQRIRTEAATWRLAKAAFLDMSDPTQRVAFDVLVIGYAKDTA